MLDCWLPEASDGTFVIAPHCLQRTVLPANFSSALKPLPHWGQWKEILMICSFSPHPVSQDASTSRRLTCGTGRRRIARGDRGGFAFE